MDGAARESRLNDLDCIFCGRWFPTFSILFAHVARAHARVPFLRTGHGELDAVPSVVGRLAARTRLQQQGSVSAPMGIPKPTGGTSGSDFNPFIKPKDIGKGVVTVMLQGGARMHDGNFGPQIIVPVKVKGKVFDWSFGLNSGNHNRLFKRFGQNENKWKGAVKVTIKKGLSGNPYIAIVD